MSTTSQIKANRQNSQKSTGPTSAEGKKAVSKNAVRHGLFAKETVIKCESAEEFEAFRDEMLAEVAPVGPVESMLAERLVSLSWRLKRVERMQNQAIDVMIEKDGQPNPFAKLAQSMLPKHLRQLQADASEPNPELVLGRAAIKDYSNSRVLDRLMMYERRIENSMIKTMHELERLRLLRELEQANEDEEQFEPESFSPQIHSGGSPKEADYAPEFLSTKNLETLGVNFAKQSQSPAFVRKSEARITKSETFLREKNEFQNPKILNEQKT